MSELQVTGAMGAEGANSPISEGVRTIIDACVRHHGSRPRFGSLEDRTLIWEWELAYRVKGRRTFAAWLERPDEPAKLSASVFTLSQFEAQDLTSCLAHPANATSGTRKLRSTLASIRDEGTSADRPARLAEVHEILRAMEATAKADARADFRIGNGCANKWTVLTALLSFANPHFPFIRPTNQDPRGGGAAQLLFGDIPWESAPSKGKYQAYCQRFDEITSALGAADLGPNPLGVLGASAWVVGAHSLMAEPAREQRLCRLARQGALILQGPPGIGKTWTAERLALALATQNAKAAGVKAAIVPLDSFERLPTGDAGVVVTHFVQFHASFDYEDFVRGFRPIVRGGAVGFELRDGPFARIVSAALRNPLITFVLVIDEINRADLARVLGECIYLLDRRVAPNESEEVLEGRKPGAVSLRYAPAEDAPLSEVKSPTSRALFSRVCLPTNVVILGTMNTADRSTAVVDVALRRRFAFYDLRPDSQAVRAFARSERGAALAPHLERVLGWMEELNGPTDDDGGADDDSGLISDPRFRIGHSYFMKSSAADLETSIQYQLLPLLREYVQDRRLDREPERVAAVLADIAKFPNK